MTDVRFVRRRTRLAVAAATVGLFALAGCSSSSESGVATAGGGAADEPAASPSVSASVSGDDQRLAFVRCLRDNGVDIPDDGLTEGPGSIDLQSTKVQEALAACQDQAPGMGGDGPLGPMSEAQQNQFIELAGCLRDEGFDVPDPKFKADGSLDMSSLVGSGINPTDPKVRAALQTCSEKVDLQLPGMN